MSIEPAVSFLSSIAGQVVERLERRAGLAEAVADDVVLRPGTASCSSSRSSWRCRRTRSARRSGSRGRRGRRCGCPCRAGSASTGARTRQLERLPGFAACAPLAFGTIAAALTHFSAIVWIFMSSVVVIVRPPGLELVAGRGVRPQTLSASSLRGPPRRSAGRSTAASSAARRRAGRSWRPSSWPGCTGRPERTVRPLGEEVEDQVAAQVRSSSPATTSRVGLHGALLSSFGIGACRAALGSAFLTRS